MCALALAALLAGAPDADNYFEVGLDYLHKGFFARARAAFAESLVRAPGQPVPLAFLGVAAAAEGRPDAQCAKLLRRAVARLPAGKSLRLDLPSRLPSPRALELMKEELRARPGLDALAVLAFLEVHDGDPFHAPAADALLERLPDDPYARALTRRPPRPPTGSSPTTPPTASESGGAA
ncbi:MAG: hypothetical protein ACREID_10100 [Planctomycetota bacterium]